MRRFFVALIAAVLTAPAMAQHAGHAPAPAAPAPAVACLPEHAAMGHCTPAPAPAAPPTAPAANAAPACLPEHAAMGHCKPVSPPTAPPAVIPEANAGQACLPEHAAMGHCIPATPAPAQAVDPHAGHAMGSQAPAQGGIGPDMTVGPDGRRFPLERPPAAAFDGPENAADRFFGQAAMAQAREDLIQEHGAMKTFKFLLDRAEVKVREGDDGYAWDAQAWYGGDINKLWLKSEGEGTINERLESSEVQALWSRAIDPWFDLQLGVRQDFQPGPSRTYLVAGLQGLAPYWFEVDGAVFVSDKGDVTARLEGEYDLRITQKVILQPRAEIEFAIQDVPELGIGSGVSTTEIGARLRYQFAPQFAPYVGIEYEHAYGDTRRFRRAMGEDSRSLSLLLGIRAWF